MSKRDAMIVDLDGTLALFGDRRSPYAAELCEGDDVCESVERIIRLFRYGGNLFGGHVILMSGRMEKHRPQTERWLTKHRIPYDALYMRATDDMRNDAIIKEELYRTHVEPRWNIQIVLDDRQRVVDMWRSIGLTCWQVAVSPD